MKSREPAPAGFDLWLDAGRTSRHYWRDLWRYRELFHVLAWRDLAVRYKQTALGVAWSVLRPVLTMAILVAVFGRIAKLPDGGIPYPILVFAGLLPWQFFANALGESSASLVANANLVSKVYFPRMILPASSLIVALVDFAISFLLLLLFVAVLRFPLSWNLLALPAFVLLAFLTALGPGLLVTALNVKYRDFRYVVPFALQMGLYLSPVGFRSDLVPGEWRLAYSLNPMVGVIDGFRWCIGGPAAGPLSLPAVGLSILVTVAFLGLGVWYFRRTEREFADLI